MSDNRLIERRFTVGPGVRHAIIWLSIITSFWAGWFTKAEIVSGERAEASLSILQTDIKKKQESRDKRELNAKNLEINMQGKTYDKDCGDKPLNTFYK